MQRENRIWRGLGSEPDRLGRVLNRPMRRVRTRLSCVAFSLISPPPIIDLRLCRALARSSCAFYAAFETERRGGRRFVVAGDEILGTPLSLRSEGVVVGKGRLMREEGGERCVAIA